jgi:hypothetical protein
MTLLNILEAWQTNLIEFIALEYWRQIAESLFLEEICLKEIY